MKYGVKVIYHANFLDEEAIDMLAANKDRLFVSPNIGFTAIASYEGQAWFSEEQVVRLGFREELAAAAKGLQELKRRGIRILGGGDYGFGLTRTARTLATWAISSSLRLHADGSDLSMTKLGGDIMMRE